MGQPLCKRRPKIVQDQAFDAYVIPAPGRVFYEAASWRGTRVAPQRRTQPLLITASDRDRLVTPYLSRAAYRIQGQSPARTDFRHYEGRSHLLLAEPGWESIASNLIAWAETAFNERKDSRV